MSSDHLAVAPMATLRPLQRLARWMVVGALATSAGVSPAWAQSLTLVTMTLRTTSAGASAFDRVAVSADGRFVAFCSTARPTDMVAGRVDGPGASNVYLRDRLTNTNELITVSATDPNRGANGTCAADVQMTPDGRYVAFRSSATNLLPPASILSYPAGEYSGFVWDRLSRTTTLVDVAVDATRAAGARAMVLSENGRFAVFSSAGSGLTMQLIPNFRDQNAELADLYVRDLQARQTRLVSRQYLVPDAGAPAGVEMKPLISPRVFGADGQVFLFTADYAQILPDMSAFRNLYVYDWRTDSIALVSVSAIIPGQRPGDKPVEVDSDTAGFTMSADGRYAVFTSTAQLTFEATGGHKHVFLRDLQAGTTRMISVTPLGNTAANGDSARPVISRDSSVIVFESLATDLVDGFTDTGGFTDVFARPRASGPVEWLSRTPMSPTGGNANASLEDVSVDGRYVSWRSAATDYLQPGIADLNGVDDLFVRDRLAQATTLTTIARTGNATANAASQSSTLLAGGAIAFVSDATDLIFTPQTAGTNIFAPTPSVADLSVTVTDAPDPAETNQLVTYTYAVSNNGPSVASSVAVRAVVPAGATFVAAEGGATPSGNVVTFALGTLAVGPQTSRTMRVRYSAPGTATASATVSSAAIDATTSNNAATATTTIIVAPSRWSISGQVRGVGNVALSGVTVTLSGGASSTTTTAADGSYAFANLAQGLTYTVTPSAPGYVFDPPSASFSNMASDQRADFLGSSGSTISGIVSDGANRAMPNVPVILAGGAAMTTTTAADGTYVFADLPRGANYTVTPSARGFVFTPASATVTSLAGDQRADFTASPPQRHDISGQVRDGGNAGLGSVTVTLTGGAAKTATTTPDGRFAFGDLPGVGTYIVTPSAIGYVFTPSSRSFTDMATDQQADFVGTCRPEIAGMVRDRLGMAVSGVTISISPALAPPVVTDAEGRFSVTEVVPGQAVTVSPNRDGFTFDPASSTVTTASCGTRVDDFLVTAGRFTRYFAEGATSDFFDTTFALFNATPDPTTARLTYQLNTGTNVVHDVDVDGLSRVTVNPELIAGLTNAEFSTVIESGQPLIADRTMRWDASGYGSHAETSIAVPLTTWYLAEGATLGGFSLFYLIQNPADTDAQVSITYLLPAPAPPFTKAYTVARRTRFNVWVNVEDPRLANAEVSAVVVASVPVIVERAMYLDRPGQFFAAGHESAGVPGPAMQWFFAEGATGPYLDLFYLLANPGSEAAVIDGQYLLPDGRVLTRQYTIAPMSRFNIWADLETFEGFAGTPLGNTAVSARFTAVNGVAFIAERSLWWPGAFAEWFEGHNAAGALRPGSTWALAEGEVGGPFDMETYILVANVSDFDDTVRVVFYFEDGTSEAITRSVLANSRTNIAVGPEVAAAAGKRFGAIVQSQRPGNPALIVVERAMYSNANGVTWAAGSNSLATRVQ